MNHSAASSASRRRLARSGFTLIEAIVIIVILGVIAAVIAPRLIQRVGQSKRAVAMSNAAALATQVKLFMAEHELSQGSTIDVLVEKPSNASDSWEPYVDSANDLLDPWGRKYILIIPGEKNFDFDLVSYGRDGRPGGTGEDEDVVKP